MKKKKTVTPRVTLLYTPTGDLPPEPIFTKLNSERKHLYVMGDFNIDLIEGVFLSLFLSGGGGRKRFAWI